MDYNKKQPVIEVYRCIQSEGSLNGVPHIIVRTTGCTHRCHVDVPGRANTMLYKPDGKLTNIKDIQVGDELLAWDTLSNTLKTTTAQQMIIDSVVEYYEVKTTKGVFTVTAEHPFLTTRGWMFAKDLSNLDELVHVDGKMRNSYRMSRNNPMKHGGIASKVHNHPNYKCFKDATHLEKANAARVTKYGSLDPKASWSIDRLQNFVSRASERMKKNNPSFDPQVLAKSIMSRKSLGWGMHGGMSKVEKRFEDLMSSAGFADTLWFTGDGGFVLINTDGKCKVPDFKVHGKNYFIEVGVETSQTGFRPSWNNYLKELDEVYSKSTLDDTKVLAINMADSDEEVIAKVGRFLSNGLKVLKVTKRLTKTPRSTYNLVCAPHDNFLVKSSKGFDGVVSHNCHFGEGGWCDSWYTSIHPEKGKFSLDEMKQFFTDNKDITHLMITGGSPTMHPELVNTLVRMFKEIHMQGVLPEGQEVWGWEQLMYNSMGVITMETEGSEFIETEVPIDLISLSPKFSNTVPKLGVETPIGKTVDQRMIDQHNKFRLNVHAIKQLMDFHISYQYKPVWDGTEENLQEIEDFRTALGIPKYKTWIMPAGSDREAIIRMYPLTIVMCTREGYCFSGRDHIIAFGNLRGI